MFMPAIRGIGENLLDRELESIQFADNVKRNSFLRLVGKTTRSCGRVSQNVE